MNASLSNSQIAERFEEMAALLELSGDNPFRIRAYRNSVQILLGLTRAVGDLPPEELLEIPGIGQGLAQHIQELLKTGKLVELDGLKSKFPAGLLQILQVQGLGPKRARFLFDRLKIASLSALKAAAEGGKLRGLPGFGEKLEANILKNLQLLEAGSKRMLWWEADLLMAEMLSALRSCPSVVELSPAGSLRRGKETVGDLDILCTARGGGRAVEFFTKLPQVERVMAAGESKAMVRLKAGVQCDLRVVPPESFGAALQYFTGSKEHNVALRELALRAGYSVNEYGLFKVGKGAKPKDGARPGRPVAGRTEREIYEKLGLQLIPPELRENRGELEAARRKDGLPDLIQLGDVRGDFHNHTRLTDGTHSLEEMARAAEGMGWEWVALGDHSQSLKVAHGLSVVDLKATQEELLSIQKKMPGIRLMRSMEVDILKDGALDYPDEVLGSLDVVVGSVHTLFQMPEDVMTERILTAMRHPRLHIVGHLSGRLLGKREGYAVNTERLLEEGASSQTAFELNGQPQRQDLPDVHARRARELGCPLALTTDAHHRDQFRYMQLAVTIARRAWLEKGDVLNTMSFKELKEWLRS